MENKVLNDRGFLTGTFTDQFGAECSIQESSVSGDETTGTLIWLGVDEPEVKIFRPDEGGWKNVDIPKDALRCGRMRLSQVQVGELLPHLMYFAETGSLPNGEQLASFVKHLDEAGVQELINEFFNEIDG